MTWTSPADLREQLKGLWERGDLLRALVAEVPPWPRRLILKAPTSADLSDRFDAVRNWAAQLAATPHVRIEWRNVQHRVQGRQRLPEAVWIDGADAALALLGRRREAESWCALWSATAADLPELLPWLQRKPLAALQLAAEWPRLMAVLHWVQAHPRPGVYLRQVDVPGVDSKFIEAHRAVLAEWLDRVLPEQAIDKSAGGIAGFAQRYGFRDKPARIRLRVLDAEVALLAGHPAGPRYPDVTLDAASFAALDLKLARAFITENEINFLAFPPLPRAIVIFGAGYGWDALAQARWLDACSLHYWGDIDTHGFAILDQLRAHFPQVQSLLMDRATLMAHQAHWTAEPTPVRHALQRLNADEQALFEDLQYQRLAENLRLEQERIGYGWVTDALARLDVAGGYPAPG